MKSAKNTLSAVLIIEELKKSRTAGGKILDNYVPPTTVSANWVQWKTTISLTTCLTCRNLNGKIFGKNEIVDEEPPLHDHCKCAIIPLKAIKAGTATIDGENGADWYLKTYGKLPDNYIDKKFAEKSGWDSRKGNLNAVAPGKTIGGDPYKNRDGKLPQAPSRQWYEADLSYDGGFRLTSRILYSNDGLVFITFDHYQTFYEVTWGL